MSAIWGVDEEFDHNDIEVIKKIDGTTTWRLKKYNDRIIFSHPFGYVCLDTSRAMSPKEVKDIIGDGAVDGKFYYKEENTKRFTHINDALDWLTDNHSASCEGCKMCGYCSECGDRLNYLDDCEHCTEKED